MSGTRAVRIVPVAGLLLLGLSFWTGPAGAAAGVPYTDPSAVGYIGLCNQAGQQITSGRVDTVPFVWRVVSSVPAKPPYNGAGRTATFYAFLPLQGFPPGDWSGETLTAATTYSNPTAPMAAATDRDEPLKDFIEAYPPKWDGFVQLRMYLDVPDQPAESLHYPALNIQVSGGSWHAVGGGAVNCAAGTAVSQETALLPPPTTAPPSSRGTSGGKSGSTTSPGAPGGKSATTTTSPGAPGGKSAPATTVPSVVPQHAASAQGATSAGSGTTGRRPSPRGASSGLIAGVIVGVLVILGSGLYFWTKRRRAAAGGTSAIDPESSSTTESDRNSRASRKGT